MPLANTRVNNAKPKQKPYKLFDEKGLFLIVTPKGGKWWRFKYQLNGKEKTLSLGTYPDTSLKQARDQRDDARRLVANDTDPSTERKKQKNEALGLNSFEVVGREWHKQQELIWTERHSNSILRRIEKDIFPKLGDKDVAKISSSDVLDCLRKVEKRGSLDMAKRLLEYCNNIFIYAIATDKLANNPAYGLSKALKSRQVQNRLAFGKKDLPEFFKRLNKNPRIGLRVKYALLIVLLTAVRGQELRFSTWDYRDC